MAGIPEYSERIEKKFEKAGKKAEENNPHFKFTNMNPAGVSVMTGNCAVRAIALAEQVTYQQAEKELLDTLIEIGYGNYAYCSETYLDETYVLHQSYGAVKGQSRMTAGQFAEQHPSGRYVLRVAHHLTACIDGKICDTWDCTKKCVYKVWDVTKYGDD